MKNRFFLAAIVLVLVAAVGCASMSKKEKGATVGATTGAVIGGVIGNQSGNTAVGAIMGAVIGGAAGTVIGGYMDDQAEEMEDDLEGADITRVGEGIKVTFGSGILFDVDKANIRPDAQTSLTKLSQILRDYPDTNILIEGHTDADGAEDYNQSLSERRAKSVSHFLALQNVVPGRMSTMGYGEMQPVGSNETTEGKQTNRRVEIAIMANEELKARATKEAGEG